ncbi:hypothetical protein C0Q70_14029 [Pomacea canaliculata]|uniref:Probable ATP-dependent RNA helicase DDX52 n=1 Tax=Pomacea canaliculata TaxID=400727 RepID=A0A2T7NYV4_POMCA|nr:hypothetical protein C0Q70_14029 [Pomacea canaliculata]
MDRDIFKTLCAGVVFTKKNFTPATGFLPKEENTKSQPSKADGLDKPKRHKKKKKKNKNAEQRKQEFGNLEDFEQLSSYGVLPRLIENIKKAGFAEPTAIQKEAIPVMMDRREIMACAPTGSGKTAAFLIPVLHYLREPRNNGFRALILAPTRELAKQILDVCKQLSVGIGFRCHYIEKASTATSKFGPKSKKNFDVLVSTPNRLVFMLNQDPPLIDLSNVQWLVIDESDKLFEAEGSQNFRDQLATIYKACSSDKVRHALFSATFAFDLQQWARKTFHNVVEVTVGASESGKRLAIRDIIRKGIEPPVLIFVQSKDRAKELFSELIYDGINVDVIHADKTQLQRDNTVASFEAGHIWVLICTELMGRGIDFKNINLVINYDFPTTAVSYIHRIGRTGRAGRPGRALTFFTEDDLPNLRSIANVMRRAGCPVPAYMLKLGRPSKRERKRTVPVKRKHISTVRHDGTQKSKKRKVDQPNNVNTGESSTLNDKSNETNRRGHQKMKPKKGNKNKKTKISKTPVNENIEA